MIQPYARRRNPAFGSSEGPIASWSRSSKAFVRQGGQMPCENTASVRSLM
jgi:hypothetical protein